MLEAISFNRDKVQQQPLTHKDHVRPFCSKRYFLYLFRWWKVPTCSCVFARRKTATKLEELYLSRECKGFQSTVLLVVVHFLFLFLYGRVRQLEHAYSIPHMNIPKIRYICVTGLQCLWTLFSRTKTLKKYSFWHNMIHKEYLIINNFLKSQLTSTYTQTCQ
jgi:hypothetical protein